MIQHLGEIISLDSGEDTGHLIAERGFRFGGRPLLQDETAMPVMMISEVRGQSTQGYDAMLALVGSSLKQAPGFIMHMAHQTDDGWRIVEVWNSREDATAFFAAHIAPQLPDGIRPKLSFQRLHSLVNN